jgi:hypothetical protein
VNFAKPQPDKASIPEQKLENARAGKPDPRYRVWAAEAIGLIIIAVMIVVYALLRYGRSIPWNAR